MRQPVLRASALALTVVSLSACQMALPETLSKSFAPKEQVPAHQAQAEMVAQLTEEGVAEGEAQDQAEAALAQAFVDAAQAAQVDAEAPKKKGFLAFLKRAADPSPLTGTEIEVVEGTSAENAMTALAPDADEATAAEAEADADEPVTAETTEVRTAGLGGLFRFLKPKAKGPAQETAQPVAPEATPNAEGETRQEADESFAARPETHGVSPEAKPRAKPRKPLFAFLKPRSKTSGPVSTVKPGETLAFGEVGVACDLRRRAMGEKVDQFPRDGRPVWQLYDTSPDSTDPRTQFITGFADGCARQVTAALVMFGEAELHEVLRYSENNDADWSDADKRYERIKRSACGVGRKERCPEEKLDALEHQLAFVSVYPRFGAESGWLELLLHDGAVESEEIR